jgi:hypothetical protein
MKISREPNGLSLLEVTETELITINNCINDAADLMRDGEFHARVGVERQQALLIVKEISKQFSRSGGPL